MKLLLSLITGLCLTGSFFSTVTGTLSEQETLLREPLHAYSAVLYDADGERVLFEKNGQEKLPIASTTKIMTLLVVLENSKPDERVLVSKNAAAQPDVQLGIREGEEYYVRDLCYSLMLQSHNDSAVALAEHVSGSVSEFAKKMNQKAKSFQANSAYFVTPNGLDQDNNGCNACDLAKIAAKAIESEEFLKITNTQIYSFSELKKGRSFTVDNKNRFLHMMDGAIGIKTGFTGKAGYCFVGAISKGEHRLISVVLACGWPPNKNLKWTDTRLLMEYGLKNFKKKQLLPSGEPLPVLQNLKVLDGVREEVSLTFHLPLLEELQKKEMLLSDADEISYQLSFFRESITAPVFPGSRVGTLTVLLSSEPVFYVPIETKQAVDATNFSFFFQKVLRSFFQKWNTE